MEGQYIMLGREASSSRGRGTSGSRGRGSIGRILGSSSSQMIRNVEENWYPKMMVKPIKDSIISLEDVDLKFTSDPFFLATKYFGINCYFPNKGNKNRQVYELILEESKSAKFEHTLEKGNASQSYFAFSKVKILKVLSISEWGTNPNNLRYYGGVNGNFFYNYWDYIDAWMNTFLYQNPQMKHNWLLRFEKEFSYQDFPNWFILTWKKIGPTKEVLPVHLSDLFDVYCKTHPEFKSGTLDEQMTDRALLYYLAQFSIPWIWSWSLIVGKDSHQVPCLSRTYSFRWWQKFDVSEILKEVRTVCLGYQDDIKVKGKKRANKDDGEDDNLEMLKVKFLKKHPQFTDEMLEMSLKESFYRFLKNDIEDYKKMSTKSVGKKAKTTINI